MVGECNDEINVPHKLLLTDKQVLRTGKAFTNGSPVNMKFSKTQLMVWSGGIPYFHIYFYIQYWPY